MHDKTKLANVLDNNFEIDEADIVIEFSPKAFFYIHSTLRA